MFDVKDFTYTSTTECGVLSLRPQGKIMDKGTVYEKNENTRFSIISGVKGGYTPNFLVKEGYPIELTKPRRLCTRHRYRKHAAQLLS